MKFNIPQLLSSVVLGLGLTLFAFIFLASTLSVSAQGLSNGKETILR